MHPVIEDLLMFTTFVGGTGLAWFLIDRISARYSRPQPPKPTKPAS
jgi:hypothetical protein